MEVKAKYSCPLKKRPIPMFVEPFVKDEPEQDEPVNLCIRKNKEEQIPYVNKMPLKDITSHNQQERIRYAPYKVEERVPYVKQELYNMLPGYAANTTNTLHYTQTSPPQSASSIKSEPEYWQSFSREASMSPPTTHMFVPSPPPMKTREFYPSENVMKSQFVKTHRYAPYVNHVVEDYHSSTSPTHSHSSLNSLGGSRNSMSPASTSSSLEERERVVMKSDMPRYQCSDCSKSYSTYSGLTKHKQFHCTASPNSQAKKSFDCQFCEKTYTSLGALKMHIRTHTKPCKCHLCGKAFSRPWLLQGHIRTHTGDKPFSCQYCHRAFADKSNLRAHLQTHSDVKKYSCSTCSKTFSRMSLLTKHTESGCPGLHEHHH